ncbi:Uncharacterised protein [Chlamydia abortus]|nr:Uncharacterised protein [Chlamydia abortus]SGA32461.1 Uncharacterised protein [Chlamydia abortus]SGA33736.1 Uncharacterised protein [Chlamydia abortus]
MSILIILFSLSNKFSASALASSVLPTPVGPKKRKLPIGLLGSLIFALALLIVSATNLIASSCPLTLSLNACSKLINLFF